MCSAFLLFYLLFFILLFYTDPPEVICLTNHQAFIFLFVAVAITFLVVFTLYMCVPPRCLIRITHIMYNLIKRKSHITIDPILIALLVEACLVHTLISQTVINN